MKITRDNLDLDIIKQLDLLTELSTNLATLNSNDLLTYADGKFIGKQVNNLALRKIVNLSEIEHLYNHLYRETSLIHNSTTTNFNVNNQFNENFRSQIVSIKGYSLFKTEGEVRSIKSGNDYILALDRTGIFYKYDMKKDRMDYTLDIATKVKSYFAIDNFLPYDILDYEIFRGGFLFSTTNNGVFFADIQGNNLEVVFPEANISDIKAIDNDKILIICRNGEMTIYDFDSQLKLQTYNTMKKLNQTVSEVQFDGDRIYVLGVNKYTHSTKSVLHVLEKDLAGIGFNNITNKVFPGYNSINTIILTLHVADSEVTLIGIKNGNVLVWKYDKNNLQNSFEEIIYDKLSVTENNFVKLYDGKLHITYNDRLVCITEDGRIHRNMELGIENARNLTFINDKIYLTSGNTIYWYELPKYTYEENMTLDIYKGESTNNIEVLIAGSTGDQLITFVDPETLEDINPNYHMVYKNNSYIKITGRNITELVMKMKITKDTVIDGIVVNADRIFLK